MKSTFINRAIVMVLLTLYFLLVPAFGEKNSLRLISTCPAITEILYYLHLDKQLIAISNQCDYPKECQSKIRCCGMNLNLEKIISLQPDYVIIMKGFRNGEESILKSASLNVIVLNLNDVSHIVSSIKLLGDKFNRKKLSLDFEKKLDTLKKNISKTIKNEPLVYVETWGNPLMSVGGTSFISDLIKIAGGHNIFSNVNKDNIEITSESILAHNPNVIIVAYPEKLDSIYNRPLFKNIDGIKKKKVYSINPDIIVRPGPRILDGISKLHKLFLK